MVDVALLVGGVVMIFGIVPLASVLAKRMVRGRPQASARTELPPEVMPDLVADLVDVVAHMSGFRFRLIDSAGSELAIVTYAVPNIREGDTVHLPGARRVTVLEVYDDEASQEGDVRATLIVDDS